MKQKLIFCLTTCLLTWCITFMSAQNVEARHWGNKHGGFWLHYKDNGLHLGWYKGHPQWNSWKNYAYPYPVFVAPPHVGLNTYVAPTWSYGQLSSYYTYPF